MRTLVLDFQGLSIQIEHRHTVYTFLTTKQFSEFFQSLKLKPL